MTKWIKIAGVLASLNWETLECQSQALPPHPTCLVTVLVILDEKFMYLFICV